MTPTNRRRQAVKEAESSRKYVNVEVRRTIEDRRLARELGLDWLEFKQLVGVTDRKGG